jgi:hypothetical protein
LDNVEIWVPFATIFSSNECPVSSLIPLTWIFSGYLLESYPGFLFSRVMSSQFIVKFPVFILLCHSRMSCISPYQSHNPENELVWFKTCKMVFFLQGMFVGRWLCQQMM